MLALGVVGVGFYVWSRGGLSNAAKGAGAAVVNAAGAAVNGAVGAVSEAVGLPTPDDTTTDPRVARWIIDNAGAWQASKWAGVPALVAAAQLPAGSGKPPAPGTRLAAAFPNFADYDETDRLTRRYPAPFVFPDNYSDPTQYGFGA